MGRTGRRDFMRAGLSAAACMSLAGLPARRIFAEAPQKFTRIAYRELGSTGCRVSEVGFGAMNMRDPELLRAALDYGINYIDTAWAYMNGVNEQVVGQVTKPVRDRVFITTKVIPGEPGQNPGKVMMTAMETSLKRLQTDHVDLMLLHDLSARDGVLNNDWMGVLEKARQKGLCRFIGVSTHGNHVEVLDAAVESKFWQAVLVGYNYMSPPGVTPAIERARKVGLGIIGMKNLLNPIDLATWNWEKIPDIRKDRNAPLSPTQALIKWVLENPFVDTTVPGVTSFEQLAGNVAIMGMKMGFEDHGTLHRFGEYIHPHYCRGVAGCAGCRDRCPYGVRPGDLNRCLRYAFGYGDIGLAMEQYALLPESSRVERCDGCEECTVHCTYGLNLNDTVRHARTLFGQKPA